MPTAFDAARAVLRQAVLDRAFPAAVIEVGDATRPLWSEAFGRLSFDTDAPAARPDTIFDLASLTKVLATTPFVMQDVERGTLGMADPVSRYIDAWKGPDRADVSIRDLLAHCSGLPGHRPLFREHRGRAGFEQAICSIPLEYEPRSRSIYSDLGFMLLGFILEDRITLDRRLDALKAQVGTAQDLQFRPPDLWRRRTAPTQLDPWRGHVLLGEVDDENAWALGGIAGHAGLFGTAAAVGDLARHLLQILGGRLGVVRQDTLSLFVTRTLDVPGSSRALGWDTMLPTSSCGRLMSPRAFGHTGFTGTSLWIDPERDAYVVLLTNRVHPTRTNDAIGRVRPVLHDAVMRDLPPGR
jgi:CubicO group peptidase (beta-lactamase class C family)